MIEFAAIIAAGGFVILIATMMAINDIFSGI